MEELYARGTTTPPEYWLVVRRGEYSGINFPEAVVLDVLGSKEALAVFSFREEADMFAGTLDPEWSVEGFSSDSLLEVLRDHYAHTSRIALDPLPEAIIPGIASLLSVSRDYFAYNLLRRSQHIRELDNDRNRAS